MFLERVAYTAVQSSTKLYEIREETLESFQKFGKENLLFIF